MFFLPQKLLQGLLQFWQSRVPSGTWQRLTRNQKFALISLFVLLLALPAGVYLSQKTQIFNPKATETKQSDQQSSPMDVKVLVLNYFPLDSSGTQLDFAVTGSTKTLEDVRNWTNTYTQQGITKLTDASKYHGYKNPSSSAYLNYSVLETKEFLKTIPKNPDYNKPDYNKILTDDVNICDYVDNRGVRQVWMWGYHYGNIAPDESNMAMGRNSQNFWNNTSYGDISNSNQINDMPTCQNTYTLYNYNFERNLGELLEDHGHQIEQLFKYIDNVMWENRFVQPFGQKPPTVNHCGWIHSPPNTVKEYDWGNTTDVLSDCENWKPDGSGEAQTVNCHTWQGESCPTDGGVAFKAWWMQNIPGFNNNLTFQGRNLRNWWEFYGDLDSALAKGYMLTTSLPGDWQYLSHLPDAVYANAAVVANGYLFSIGGFENGQNIGRTAMVYSAKINSDGTLGDWIATTSLPRAVSDHSVVVYNDYLYVLGGEGWGSSSNVYSAKINSGGTLGNWVSLISLPATSLTGTAVVAYNGRLYVTGGLEGGRDQTKSVYSAGINADGTIGNWSSLESLPQPLDEHASVISDGYIFVIGGRKGVQNQSLIYSAKINNDGILSSWTNAGSLPIPLAYHSAVVYQEHIFVIGGELQSTVYVAKVNSDGTLGNWLNAASLPQPLTDHASVESGGYLYTLGGASRSFYSKVVFSALALLPSSLDATPTPVPSPTPISTPIPTPTPFSTPSPTPIPTPSRAPSPSPTPTGVRQSVTLAQGFNFIGLNVDKGSSYKAEDFLRDLNAGFVPADVPNKKTPLRNKVFAIYHFESHWRVQLADRTLSDNFSVIPGEGYVVLSLWPGTVVVSGNTVTLSSMSIGTGWSLIVFPPIPTSLASAEDVLQEMQNQGIDVKVIYRWFGGRYIGHDLGSATNDFSLTNGEGYWIRNPGDVKAFTLP